MAFWYRKDSFVARVQVAQGRARSFLSALAALAFFSAACGASSSAEPGVFAVEHRLASDIDPTAPTTVGIVTFSVDGADITGANVEFGLDTSYGMVAPVDLGEPNYRTLLLGMKPARQYHYRIVATDHEKTYVSGDYVIETGEPTTLVSIAGVNVVDEANREKGFIITSFRYESEALDVPFVLDSDGEIVWWYARGTPGTGRAIMSADGRNMWMVTTNNSGLPVQRVTMDGLDEQTYDGTRGSHDMTAVRGETMAFLDYGERDCDSIFEIDPSGVTTEVFESEGLVDPDAGLVGCHGNALRYSSELDAYSFSDRHQDILFVNRTDGLLLFRLSELVSGGNVAWGEEQHGHQWTGDRLLLFANNGGGEETSAVIEYTADGEETMRYVSGDYTRHYGDVQRLPGGNLLVTYSNASIIREIDAEQNVLFEIDAGGQWLGYATWTESLYPRASDPEG